MSAVVASVQDLQRFGVKLFAGDPGAVRLDEFVPIFHRWIRTRRVEETVVDVADYGHLADGPGVILAGHEADYRMDTSEGPLGLLYVRKRPLEGGLSDRFRFVLRAALAACARLEEEPVFEGMLRFRGAEVRFVANDRLRAPNTPESFAELRPELEAVAARLYGGAKVELTRVSSDPRERLAVRIRSAVPYGVATLLSRLA